MAIVNTDNLSTTGLLEEAYVLIRKAANGRFLTASQKANAEAIASMVDELCNDVITTGTNDSNR